MLYHNFDFNYFERIWIMTIFEQIVSGKIPARKVLENDDFLAFYDINPKAPIHVLAIPKRCVKDFEEMDSAMMASFSAFIKEVVKVLGLKNGYRLITNIGADGGQEVPHLHFHILGGAKLKWDNLA